jgi:hypothetical protein
VEAPACDVTAEDQLATVLKQCTASGIASSQRLHPSGDGAAGRL